METENPVGADRSICPKTQANRTHSEKNAKQKKEGTYFDVPLQPPLQIETPAKNIAK